MEKFLKNHKLADDGHNANKCYLIEVFNECEKMVDMLHAYCFLDVMRVTAYYLETDERFWYAVKTTKL